MNKYPVYEIIDMNTGFSLSTLLLYAEDIGNRDNEYIDQPLHDGNLWTIKKGNKIYCYWWEWGTEFSKEVEELIKDCEEK